MAFFPPAIATPSTAATTGTSTRAMASQAQRNATNIWRSASGPWERSNSTSSKSPPAQKFPSAPRIMTTVTVGSLPNSTIAYSSSRLSATVMAFIRSGRLSVIHAIPSATSLRTSVMCAAPW